MSGTGNRAGGESAGGKLKQLIQKLPYHIIGIAGAASPAPSEGTLKTSSRELRLPYSGRVSPAAKGLISKEKALLIFHEGRAKFPPRPAGREKNSKKTRKREKGEKEKWQ